MSPTHPAKDIVYGVEDWSVFGAAQRSTWHYHQLTGSQSPHALPAVVNGHHPMCSMASQRQAAAGASLIPGSTHIAFLYRVVRCVILLDLSPSVAQLSSLTSRILFESLYQSAAATILSIAQPAPLHTPQPDIWVSIIAVDWSWCPIKVIMQNSLVKPDTVQSVLTMLAARLADLESQLASMEAQKVERKHHSLASSSPAAADSSNDLTTLLQIGLDSFDRMPNYAAPVLVVCSDGVLSLSSSASEYNAILQEMDRRDVRCCVLQVSPVSSEASCSYSYVPDTDMLQFVADSTAGAYYDLNAIKDALQQHHIAYKATQHHSSASGNNSNSTLYRRSSSSTQTLTRTLSQYTVNEDCALCWLSRPLFRDLVLRSSCLHSVVRADGEVEVVRLMYKRNAAGNSPLKHQHDLLHQLAMSEPTTKVRETQAPALLQQQSIISPLQPAFTAKTRSPSLNRHNTVVTSTTGKQLIRHGVKSYLVDADLEQLMICRVREGFRHTIARINTDQQCTAAHLIVEWKPSIYIEYHITRAQASEAEQQHEETEFKQEEQPSEHRPAPAQHRCSIYVVADSAFIDMLSSKQRQQQTHQLLQMAVHAHREAVPYWQAIWQFIDGMIDTDTVLLAMCQLERQLYNHSDTEYDLPNQLTNLLQDPAVWSRWLDVREIDFVVLEHHRDSSIGNALLELLEGIMTVRLSSLMYVKACHNQHAGLIFVRAVQTASHLYALTIGFFRCQSQCIATTLALIRDSVLGLTTAVLEQFDEQKDESDGHQVNVNLYPKSHSKAPAARPLFARTASILSPFLQHTTPHNAAQQLRLRSTFRTHSWWWRCQRVRQAYNLLHHLRQAEGWLLAHNTPYESTYIRELRFCARCRVPVSDNAHRQTSCKSISSHDATTMIPALIQYSMRILSDTEIQVELWFEPTHGVYHLYGRKHHNQILYTVGRKEMFASFVAWLHSTDLHLLSALQTLDTVVDIATLTALPHEQQSLQNQLNMQQAATDVGGLPILLSDYMCHTSFSYANDSLNRYTSRLRSIPSQPAGKGSHTGSSHNIKGLTKHLDKKYSSLITKQQSPFLTSVSSLNLFDRESSTNTNNSGGSPALGWQHSLGTSYSSQLMHKPSMRSLNANMHVHTKIVNSALELYSLHRKQGFNAQISSANAMYPTLSYFWLCTASIDPTIDTKHNQAVIKHESIPLSLTLLLDYGHVRRLPLDVPTIAPSTSHSSMLQARQLMHDMLVHAIKQLAQVEIITERCFAIAYDNETVGLIVLPSAPLASLVADNASADKATQPITPRHARQVSDSSQSNADIVRWLNTFIERHSPPANQQQSTDANKLNEPIDVFLVTCLTDTVRHPTTDSTESVLADGRRRSRDQELHDLNLLMVRDALSSPPTSFMPLHGTIEIKKYDVTEQVNTINQQLIQQIHAAYHDLYVRAVFVDLLDQVHVTQSAIQQALSHCQVFQRDFEVTDLQLYRWPAKSHTMRINAPVIEALTSPNTAGWHPDPCHPSAIYQRLRQRFNAIIDKRFSLVPNTSIYYHQSPVSFDPFSGISSMFDSTKADVSTILQLEPFFMQLECAVSKLPDDEEFDQLDVSEMITVLQQLVTEHLSRRVLLDLKCYSITSEVPTLQYIAGDDNIPAAVKTALDEMRVDMSALVADAALHAALWLRKPSPEQLQGIVTHFTSLASSTVATVDVDLHFVPVETTRARMLFPDRLLTHCNDLRWFTVNTKDKRVYVLQHSDDVSADRLPYWLTMEVRWSNSQHDADVAVIKLHKAPLPPQQVDAVLQTVRSAVLSTCRRVNQECLLHSLNSARLCSQLLAAADPNDDVGQEQNDSPTHRLRNTWKTEEFACPLQASTYVALHERVNPLVAVRSVGSSAFSAFSVANRANVYVYQEPSGSIFYLKLSSREAGAVAPNAAERAIDTATSPALSRKQSISTPSSAANSSDSPPGTPALERYRSATMTIRHSRNNSGSVELPAALASPNKQSSGVISQAQLVIEVYGLQAPTVASLDQLNILADSKVDTYTLSVISQLLVRNPMFKLTPSDHRFIRPLDSRPDKSMAFPLQLRLPADVGTVALPIKDVYLFLQYFRQNMDRWFNQLYLAYNVERDRLVRQTSPQHTRRATGSGEPLPQGSPTTAKPPLSSLQKVSDRLRSTTERESTVRHDMKMTDLYYYYNNYSHVGAGQLKSDMGKGMAAIYCSVLDTRGRGPVSHFRTNAAQPWYAHAAEHDNTEKLHQYAKYIQQYKGAVDDDDVPPADADASPLPVSSGMQPMLVDMLTVPSTPGGVSAVADEAASGFDLMRHMRIHSDRFSSDTIEQYSSSSLWWLSIEYWGMGNVNDDVLVERLACIVNYALHAYMLETNFYCQRLTVSASWPSGVDQQPLDRIHHALIPVQSIIQSNMILRSPVNQRIQFEFPCRIMDHLALTSAIHKLLPHFNSSLHMITLQKYDSNIADGKTIMYGGLRAYGDDEADEQAVALKSVFSPLITSRNANAAPSTDQTSTRNRANTLAEDEEAVDTNTCNSALDNKSFSSTSRLMYPHIKLPPELYDAASVQQEVSGFVGCASHRLKYLYRHFIVIATVSPTQVDILTYNWRPALVEQLESRLYRLCVMHLTKHVITQSLLMQKLNLAFHSSITVPDVQLIRNLVPVDRSSIVPSAGKHDGVGRGILASQRTDTGTVAEQLQHQRRARQLRLTVGAAKRVLNSVSVALQQSEDKQAVVEPAPVSASKASSDRRSTSGISDAQRAALMARSRGRPSGMPPLQSPPAAAGRLPSAVPLSKPSVDATDSDKTVRRASTADASVPPLISGERDSSHLSSVSSVSNASGESLVSRVSSIASSTYAAVTSLATVAVPDTVTEADHEAQDEQDATKQQVEQAPLNTLLHNRYIVANDAIDRSQMPQTTQQSHLRALDAVHSDNKAMVTVEYHITGNTPVCCMSTIFYCDVQRWFVATPVTSRGSPQLLETLLLKNQPRAFCQWLSRTLSIRSPPLELSESNGTIMTFSSASSTITLTRHTVQLSLAVMQPASEPLAITAAMIRDLNIHQFIYDYYIEQLTDHMELLTHNTSSTSATQLLRLLHQLWLSYRIAPLFSLHLIADSTLAVDWSRCGLAHLQLAQAVDIMHHVGGNADKYKVVALEMKQSKYALMLNAASQHFKYYIITFPPILSTRSPSATQQQRSLTPSSNITQHSADHQSIVLPFKFIRLRLLQSDATYTAVKLSTADRDAQALHFLQQQVESLIQAAVRAIAKQALRDVRREARRSMGPTTTT